MIPVTIFHSTIERPDCVNRVIPPTTTMRTIKDITVDSIARKYGGNGHPKAAGYSVSLE